MARIFPLKEGSNHDITFTPLVDTSGETISVRFIEEDSAGTGQNVGTVAGVSANTDVTVEMATKDLSPGNYYLEIISDFGGASPTVLYPNNGQAAFVKIEDMKSFSN